MANQIFQPSNVPPLNPPSSIMPNTFPRRFIGSTENILFETKPQFSAYFFTGKGIAYLIFIILMVFISITLIIFFALYSPKSDFAAIIAVIVFLSLFVFLPIAIMTISYKNTFYAMTDSRVLVAHGILNKNLTSATYDMITSINVMQPWLMSKMTKLGFIKFDIPSFGRGMILWSFIKQPSETYRYILDIKNIYDTSGAIATTYFQANVYGNVMAANMGNQKRCINCGSYIKASAKFCPKCGYRQP